MATIVKKSPPSFLSNLFSLVVNDGKLLSGYLLTQIPQITSFPGVITAVKTAVVDRTPASFVDVGVQALMAIAAGMRARKLVIAAARGKDSLT